MNPCPVHEGQEIDGGPDCCDLSCRFDAPPLRWEGDDT